MADERTIRELKEEISTKRKKLHDLLPGKSRLRIHFSELSPAEREQEIAKMEHSDKATITQLSAEIDRLEDKLARYEQQGGSDTSRS